MANGLYVRNGKLCGADDFCGSVLVIPDGVREIDHLGFWENPHLTELVIPGSVKVIGDSAFKECKHLKTVTLLNGIEQIGRGTFAETAIAEIMIPGSVKEIGESAFYGCGSLKKAVLAEGVEKIGWWAFRDTPIAEITIPGSLKVIEKDAFYNCKSIKVTLAEGTEKIEAFGAQQIHAAEITIPHSVKSIGADAFHGCTSLKKAILPEGIEKIERSAFENTGISELTIPGKVKVIGEKAFRLCKSLKKVTLAEGVETIGESAFERCYGLEYISFPSTLKKIGSKAFSGDETHHIKLKRVYLPAGVRSVAKDAFDCTGALFIVAKNSCAEWICRENSWRYEVMDLQTGGAAAKEVVGDTLYFSSAKDKEIVIPQGVRAIEKWAFAENPQLEAVGFPSSLTEIRTQAFADHRALRKLTFAQGLKKIGSKAFSGFPVPSVDLPSTIEELAPDAFGENCVVSIAGEMPFYSRRTEQLEEKKRQLGWSRSRQKKLTEQKATLEQQIAAYTRTAPEKFTQIPDRQARLEAVLAANARQAQAENDQSAALKEQLAQLETETAALAAERKRCGLFAVSRKKELDAAIKAKDDSQRDLQETIRRQSADSAAAEAEREEKRQKAALALDELITSKKAWNDKKLEMMAACAAADRELQDVQESIKRCAEELATGEQKLKSDHDEWKCKKAAAEELIRRQELTERKAAILTEIGSFDYRQEGIPASNGKGPMAEQQLLQQSLADMIRCENAQRENAARAAFAEAHKTELEEIRQINRRLGIAELAGIEDFVLPAEPDAAFSGPPERFVRINALFQELETWAALKQAAKECVCKKTPKTNLVDRLFAGIGYLKFKTEDLRLLLFPYCAVLCDRKDRIAVQPLDAIRLSLKCEEHEEDVDTVPPGGEQIGEHYLHLNKDGSPSLRYKYNPLLKVIRYTQLAVAVGSDTCLFPVPSHQIALRLAEAYDAYTQILCSETIKSVYALVRASADPDAIAAEMSAVARRKAEQQLREQEAAAAERQRLAEERSAAQAAAEEQRQAIIRRQKEQNEERKRREQEKAEAARQAARLFADDFAEEEPSAAAAEEPADDAPFAVVGKRLISNTVFKVTLQPVGSPAPDEAVAYFVSESGEAISNKKKLTQTAAGEAATVGFMLNTGVDYTVMPRCLLRIEQQGQTVGEISFRMSLLMTRGYICDRI